MACKLYSRPSCFGWPPVQRLRLAGAPHPAPCICLKKQPCPEVPSLPCPALRRRGAAQGGAHAAAQPGQDPAGARLLRLQAFHQVGVGMCGGGVGAGGRPPAWLAPCLAGPLPGWLHGWGESARPWAWTGSLHSQHCCHRSSAQRRRWLPLPFTRTGVLGAAPGTAAAARLIRLCSPAGGASSAHPCPTWVGASPTHAGRC